VSEQANVRASQQNIEYPKCHPPSIFSQFPNSEMCERVNEHASEQICEQANKYVSKQASEQMIKRSNLCQKNNHPQP
jgi:hypothetical protein